MKQTNKMYLCFVKPTERASERYVIYLVGKPNSVSDQIDCPSSPVSVKIPIAANCISVTSNRAK